MVHGTMNGYGERNENANLTTIIPNLELKMDTHQLFKTFGKIKRPFLFVDDATNLRPDIRSPYGTLHPSPTKVESMQCGF